MEIKAIVAVMVVLAIQSCNTAPDLEKEKNAIMVLHNKQRQAHFEKNIPMLFENAAADLMQVNRGVISKNSMEENNKRFGAYFDAVEFVKWDDAEPPVFSFSDDATMATTLVNKLVVVKLKQENMRLDTTHFAWMAVYKKTNGEWQLHRIASTNK
jgi:hypothetical protein